MAARMEQKSQRVKKRIEQKPLDTVRALLYAAGVLGLAALVVCAFFLPSLLFGIRDDRLCEDIVLEEREGLDVTFLGETYELSLYNRMANFAQGLAEGRNYYVSSQELEVDDELREMLMSGGEDGLYQGPFWAMLNTGLLNYEFSNYFQVESRKQYVIYSDDYTQGVNFIIWQLVLTLDGGERLEVLMDAQTHTIYGLKAEKNRPVLGNQSTQQNTLTDFIGSSEMDAAPLWVYFCYYYEAFSETQMEEFYTRLINNGYTEVIGDMERYGYILAFSFEKDYEKKNYLPEEAQWTFVGEDTLAMHISYGENKIDFEFSLRGNTDEYVYPDAVVGIEPICRLIYGMDG